MASEASAPLRIGVCLSAGARQTTEALVQLPPGASLLDAVRASGLLANWAEADIDALQAAIWGRKQALDTPLRDGDRVELCRPLKVDPKWARRERFARQGARTAGLFSKRRAGAKSGY